MLIYRVMPDGVFLAGDTATGTVEVVLAGSFWARRAKQQPESTARTLLSRATLPNPRTIQGRTLARRNSVIINNLIELARRQSGDAVKSAVYMVGDE